jgi:hypothetical protein
MLKVVHAKHSSADAATAAAVARGGAADADAAVARPL